MAKKALGRGLNSLLGSYEEETPQSKRETVGNQPAPSVPNAAQAVNSAAQQSAPRERISMGRINAATGEIIDNTVRVEQTRPENRPTTLASAQAAQAGASQSAARTATPQATEVKAPQSAGEEQKENKASETLSLDKIKPNENQPRINFKKEELEELAASIKKDGLLQPILVRPKGDHYEIIAGERRYRASKLAGLTEVPVRIKEADDEETLELALIENIQRSDLNPIEEAYAYKRLMDKKKLNQSQLAQMVSKGRSTIANAVRLLDLPEEAQKLLYEEKITAGHARAILSIPTPEGRMKLTQKLLDSKMSVREAESFARLMSLEPKKKDPSTTSSVPKSYKKVARSLHDKLNTTVKVKTSQGRNRIEIEFKDEEDLQRLVTAMFASEEAQAEGE